jgi:hypothetical protein
MTKRELNRVLKLHAEWLADARTGTQADLREADLREADLREANLRWADLSEADLRWANLRGADLSGADLSEADLRWADLREANLRGADLREADLSEAVWSTPLSEQIERLDAVREIVLATPDRLDMDTWHSHEWTPDHTPEEEYSCGSAHCIAGWLQALTPDRSVRQIPAVDAGIQLAPIAAPMFYSPDDEALEWLKERKYAGVPV